MGANLCPERAFAYMGLSCTVHRNPRSRSRKPEKRMLGLSDFMKTGSYNQSVSKNTVEAYVAEWREGQGYGFISIGDGRRAYVHHTAFGGGSLILGARCDVIVVEDPINPGKWKVTQLSGEA